MANTPWATLSLLLATGLLAATPEECTGILRKALEDKNPETRVQAVAALSLTSETGPLFNLLKEMLNDKDVGVRQAAVTSLAEVKTAAALEALRSSLDDEVPEVSFAAAKALWLRRDPAGKKALLAVLEGETKTSSGFLTSSSGPLFDLLKEMLNDKDVGVRQAVVTSLAEVKTPAASEALRSALQDEVPEVSFAAAKA